MCLIQESKGVKLETLLLKIHVMSSNKFDLPNVNIQSGYTYIRVCVYRIIHMYMCICIYVHWSMYMCIHTYLFVCMYICFCIVCIYIGMYLFKLVLYNQYI